MSQNSIRTSTSSSTLAYIACGPTSRFGLVAIHGWSCQASDFSPLFSELVKHELNLTAFAIDLPGHGNSSKDACPVPSVSDFAQKVLAFTTEMDLTDIIMVGNSFGCRVVLDTFVKAQASGKPNVKGLVFLDGSSYKLHPPVLSSDRGEPRSASMTDEEKLLEKAQRFREMFTSHTPEVFQNNTIAHMEAMDQEYSTALRESSISYDQTLMDDAMVSLGKCGVPLLSLQSTDVDEEKRRFSLPAGAKSKWMQFIEETVPQAEQHVIESSGHFPHVDHPDIVAHLLLEFVQKIRSRDASS